MSTIDRQGDTLTDYQGAAEYLDVNERYMHELVATRRIPFLKIGRLVRFRRSDLDAFLDAARVEPNRQECTA